MPASRGVTSSSAGEVVCRLGRVGAVIFAVAACGQASAQLTAPRPTV